MVRSLEKHILQKEVEGVRFVHTGEKEAEGWSSNDLQLIEEQLPK